MWPSRWPDLTRTGQSAGRRGRYLGDRRGGRAAIQELVTWVETNSGWLVSGQLANGQVSSMNSGQTRKDLTTAVMPANGSVPAGDGGQCKRAGCGRPLPPGDRGRSRQFCSDECRIRHYNAQRGQAAIPAPPPADGPEASLARLSQLLAEASRLASAASAQVAAADPGRVAAVLAEAEAARRRAEAHAATASAQAAESAEDADEGGIRDADVVTRKGPAAGVAAGLWW